MDINDRKITVTLDMKDCERIISWYTSEFNTLVKWNVNPEWKKEMNAEKVYQKIQDNWSLAYQLSKVPLCSEFAVIKKSEIIWDLEKVYGK